MIKRQTHSLVVEMDRWSKKVIALGYGVIIGLTVVLFIEASLSIMFTPFIMAVIVAPIVEEFFKTQAVHMSSGVTRSNAVTYVVLSALGFGLIEAFIHSVFSGYYYVSFTPLMHIFFSLPTGIAYKQSKHLYGAGLIVSISFHAMWNFIVII